MIEVFKMFLLLISTVVPFFSLPAQQKSEKPRIVVSSDIGGTDPDDNQSMIHLLMYADRFQIEGLIASPYGDGRKKDIMKMIDLYEKDFSDLSKHSVGFPNPEYLRKITKQGAISNSSYKGFNTATEGSEWIIKCAKKASDRPLWILVWGGLEDLAQALHDAPDIETNIKVYWIGGPNKKWSVNAYTYIVENHPDLWMIEANATYRGWFMDSNSPENIKSHNYYNYYIQERGAMGKAFKNYYGGNIKMGDTPSLVYVMHGDPYNPMGESWGGSFTPITHSSRTIFEHGSTIADTVTTYGVMEWKFNGPERNIPKDSVCYTMEISGQIWPGYYLGNGTYGNRYSSKKPETASYVTASRILELNGRKGQFVSINPWPGTLKSDDFVLGDHWYGDRPDPALFLGEQQGAKTVSKHRKSFLLDWAKRWNWLNK